MSDKRDRELERAMRNGKWTFSLQPTANQPLAQASVLYTAMDPWLAQSWTVGLCGMTFSSGNPTAPPTGSGGTSDNQVDVQPNYKVRVLWGVRDVMEAIVCDYPWAGCTFMVQASTVRVDLLSPNQVSPTIPPTLSGFLVPAACAQTAIVAPVFTSGTQAIAAGGNFAFAVPKRACAYRLFHALTGTLTNNTIQANEEDSTGVVIKNNHTWPNASGGIPTDFSQQNQAGYIPLHPLSEYLRLSNSAVGIATVGVQFLLDVG